MKKVRRIGLILVSCLIAIGVLSVLYFMFQLRQSKFSRQVDDNRFFVEFYPLNGELTESFPLRKGDVIETYIIINKGYLKIVIGQQRQEPIYEGSNFSGSFQVNVPEDGYYTITVTGVKADGSTDFNMLRLLRPLKQIIPLIHTQTEYRILRKHLLQRKPMQ